MKIPLGMHPKTFKAYIDVMYKAGINPEFGIRPNKKTGSRIMQLIGDADASAGYHARDGFYTLNGITLPYTAAIDIRSTDLSKAECEKLWNTFNKSGEFAGWWRYYGSFKNNQHFHVIHLGVAQKKQLKSQCKSFWEKRTGLVGNAYEPFLINNLRLEDIEKGKKLFYSVHPKGLSIEEDIDDINEYYPCSCYLSDTDIEGIPFDLEYDDEVNEQ